MTIFIMEPWFKTDNDTYSNKWHGCLVCDHIFRVMDSQETELRPSAFAICGRLCQAMIFLSYFWIDISLIPLHVFQISQLSLSQT